MRQTISTYCTLTFAASLMLLPVACTEQEQAVSNSTIEENCDGAEGQGGTTSDIKLTERSVSWTLTVDGDTETYSFATGDGVTARDVGFGVRFDCADAAMCIRNDYQYAGGSSGSDDVESALMTCRAPGEVAAEFEGLL